jgi:DNA-binding transcriptional ArsR family regulator
VVHHSRKAESDDPFDLVSGTTGLSGSYDSLAAIADTEGARVLHLTGRDIEGAEIPLLMNDRGMYTLAMPTPDQQATATMSSTRRRVFDAVPRSTAQERAKIVEDTGLDKPSVDQQLRKLKRDGLIKVVDHGKYQKTGKRWFDESIPDFSVIRRSESL